MQSPTELTRAINTLQADFRQPNYHGIHSKKSPIVGSRAHELLLIYLNKDIFAEYQKVVYDQQKLNIIPLHLKNSADQISEQLFAEYIAKYAPFGVTITNSVCWTDCSLTRTYLSDLENPWNTWKVHAIVAKPDDSSHIQNQRYRPAYICALHELMHVEETPIGISEGQYDKYKSIAEVLTVTKTLILMDEVYKRTLNIPLDMEIDYENSFTLFGKSITQGKLANFYRALLNKHSSLAEAMVSEESLAFLNCTGYRLRKITKSQALDHRFMGSQNPKKTPNNSTLPTSILIDIEGSKGLPRKISDEFLVSPTFIIQIMASMPVVYTSLLLAAIGLFMLALGLSGLGIPIVVGTIVTSVSAVALIGNFLAARQSQNPDGAEFDEPSLINSLA